MMNTRFLGYMLFEKITSSPMYFDGWHASMWPFVSMLHVTHCSQALQLCPTASTSIAIAGQILTGGGGWWCVSVGLAA